MQSRTLLVVLLVASIAFASPESEKFKDFMKKYGKRYVPQEIPQRYNTFKENLKIIESLNAKHNRTTFGITKFADMSTEEFKRTYLSAVDMKTETKNLPVAPLYSSSEIEALPTTWDWRTKNAVTPVKNQGACGSCWSFSTTGNVEGQWAIKTGQLVGLSEQFLVDCDHHCMIYEGQQSCDAGCEGGLMPNAFAYIIQAGGIDSEASYPYEGIDDECRAKNSTIAAKISNWTMIANDEDQMAAYLYKNGPVSIAVDAQWWQFYEFGVFEFPWCGDQLDHGVLIVGFDQEVDDFGQTIEFWWVKNSWGADWGYNGYIKLERGSDQCGDNLFPCSSIA